MILMDTCALLWLVADQTKLSTQAKDEFHNNAGQLFISAISAFEIGIKSKRGKLVLPMSAEKWFHKALDFHGIHEIPLNSKIASTSVQLPPLHNDPCDRFIIATAMQHSMPIITSDQLIAQYDQVRIIW